MPGDVCLCLPAGLPQLRLALLVPHIMLGLQILPQMHSTTLLPLMFGIWSLWKMSWRRWNLGRMGMQHITSGPLVCTPLSRVKEAQTQHNSMCRGLLYCMEYLEESLGDWLGQELQASPPEALSSPLSVEEAHACHNLQTSSQASGHAHIHHKRLLY